ncbi:hypothetical protein FACS189476_01820 [Spirochaetia bacterium]|nr:hypothetical protein FACS189476_01820 [Spirochaetia bacterium]
MDNRLLNHRSASNHTKPFSAYFPLLLEFFRYILVGGTAFIVDIGILYLTRIFIFAALGTIGILLATAVGFTTGLIYNFILSTIFVFKKINKKAQLHKIRSFIIFTIIGLIGLGLTEACMYIGIQLFSEKYYLVVKIVTAAFVLIWNYTARKIFIFKGEKVE